MITESSFKNNSDNSLLQRDKTAKIDIGVTSRARVVCGRRI